MSEDNVAFLREFKKYYLALEEFDKYDKARLYCCTEAKILHSLLKKQLEKRPDMSGFKIDDKGQDSFCFKVELPEPIGEKKNIDKISISVPSDAMGNRPMDNNLYPQTMETALFSGNEIVYDPNLGYGGIFRFYGDERASEAKNIEKLIAHIKQLAQGQKPDDV
tara:strand:- start:2522 stop:3013 length:492 start_codon:yes stop_codon:yes gene_type:complete